MRINHLSFRSFSPALLILAFGLFNSASAQTNGSEPSSDAQELQTKPSVVLPEQRGAQPVTGSTNLFCSGFIQYAPAPISLQIVGGEEEQEQRIYSSGDYVYINAGAQEGIREGQEYIVTRPRGQFKSKLSKKKGWLGVYTQEVGSLRVINVKDKVSLALVTFNCDDLLLGDLLRAAPQRVSPLRRPDNNLNRFGEPTGKQNGRIVMARDIRELLSRDQVVFIDLGSEDNVKPGDYLTIYRPLGTGNITRFTDEEITPSANTGFESDRFKGGPFSNKAQRVQHPNENGVYGPMITTPKIWRSRPPMPRKVVGEMVVLSVQQRTAAAVITKVAQEVHTGDYVEIQ